MSVNCWAEFVRHSGDGRFVWRFWDPWRGVWWEFALWLSRHQEFAYASGWRQYGALLAARGWRR